MGKSEYPSDKLNDDNTLLEEESPKEELRTAIAEENYAKAAVIRDSLQKLQKDSKTQMLRVNKRFYESLRIGDLVAIQTMWAKRDDVCCVHPVYSGKIGYHDAIRCWGDGFLSDSYELNKVPQNIRVDDIKEESLEEELRITIAEENYAKATVIRNSLQKLQKDSKTQMLRVNKRFYESLRIGDLAAIQTLWAKRNDVCCVHLVYSRIICYDYVIRCWGDAFLSDSYELNKVPQKISYSITVIDSLLDVVITAAHIIACNHNLKMRRFSIQTLWAKRHDVCWVYPGYSGMIGYDDVISTYFAKFSLSMGKSEDPGDKLNDDNILLEEESLEEELRIAIAEENYAKAALIRDSLQKKFRKIARHKCLEFSLSMGKSKDPSDKMNDDNILLEEKSLEEELRTAIAEVNYAKAAIIRDSLQKLQKDSKTQILRVNKQFYESLRIGNLATHTNPVCERDDVSYEKLIKNLVLVKYFGTIFTRFVCIDKLQTLNKPKPTKIFGLKFLCLN
ncbi:hypothetical protein VNO80_13740 [Phaseolus coccineus]|uniref:UVR domain-containing protein n=1 Tax=Phaseolus coccineus TaxID=3886 RepID=A0AAN9N1N0_PHACN